MTYLVLVEPADDGSYAASVPDPPGRTSFADAVGELQESAREAIAGHVAALRELTEPVPPPSSVAEMVDAAA